MTFAKDDYASDGRMTIIDKDASGSVIRVDDAYPTPHTINKTTVFGKSDQMVIRGINIMPIIKSQTINGVVLTSNGDGSYRIKGRQTKAFTRFFTDDAIKMPLSHFGLKTGDTVFMSAEEASSKLYVAMFYFDKNGSAVYTQVATSKNITRYTIPQNVTQAYICVSLDGNVGTTVDSHFHPMVSLYSDGIWEPYTGGKVYPNPEQRSPITNVNAVNIVSSSVNICPDSQLLSGITYNSGIAGNKFGVSAKFPFVQPSEVNGVGAVLDVVKGQVYSVKYLGDSSTAAVGISEYKNRDDCGDIDKAVSCARVGSAKQLSLKAKTNGVMVFIVASQWTDGKQNINTFNKNDFIITAGDAYDEYVENYQSQINIDLKGNELCSLPNGARDELIVGSDGNVNIIKRIKKDEYISGTYAQAEADGYGCKIGDIGTSAGNYFASEYLSKEHASFGASNWLHVKNDGRWSTVEEFKKWLTGKPILFQLKEPQTINLGTIENVPRLNSTTSTIWADTNVPTDMQINYKSYLQEDTMAEKKYLDLAGLTGYDAKIKAAIDAKDAATLQGAKAYADSLGANYDAAGSAATAKQQAIDAANGHTDGEITKVNAKVGEVEKKAQQGVTDAAAAKAAADKAQGEVDALETLVGTLPEDAGVATVVAYVDKKTEGMASDTLLKQLQTTVGQHTTDISGLKEKDAALQGAVDKAQGAATANKATIDQLVGADKGKSVRAIANEELVAQLIPETADETLNTLKEIADWIQKHPNDAAAMNSAIEKLKTLIGTIPSDGVTAKDITGYIAEVKAALEKSVAAEKSRAEAAESGLGGRITTLEGKFGEGEDSVSSLIEAAKQAAISAAAADAQKKADTAKTAAVADAKKYTDTEVGKVKTASDAIGARVTAAEGKITTLESKAHTHANAEALNGITAGKVANWDAAFTAKHTHANAAALDKVTDGKITAWDGALTNAKAYTDQKIGEFVAISVSEIDSLFADA